MVEGGERILTGDTIIFIITTIPIIITITIINITIITIAIINITITTTTITIINMCSMW